MDTSENRSETWQVELGGDVHDASFDEVAAWIADGSLLRIDRVKKGELRWIEAGKVPALTEFFNAKDMATASEPVVTTSSGRTNVEVLGPKSVAASRLSVPSPAAGVSTQSGATPRRRASDR
ncbi:MAG TPA: hypothetical protein VL501_00395, partial [Pyrinomonadaceae bacterium]|nr:hypothetical protein [Pyrinomonadaceae bacterium]